MKRRLSYVFLTYSVLYSTLSLPDTQTPQDLYAAGKYTEAQAAYALQGISSSADFYNYGNTLFKLGKFGHAKAYYDMALTLDPTDVDIAYNLELAKEKLQNSGNLGPKPSFFLNFFLTTRLFFNEVYVLLFFILSVVLLGLSFGLKKMRHLRSFFISFTVFALGLVSFQFYLSSIKVGFITADFTTVRSGPGEKFKEVAKIPAGSAIEWDQDNEKGWRKILFSLGNTGWVLDKDILKNPKQSDEEPRH